MHCKVNFKNSHATRPRIHSGACDFSGRTFITPTHSHKAWSLAARTTVQCQSYSTSERMSYNGRRVRERSSRSSLFSCGLEMITQTTTYTHVTSSHTLRTTKDITSDLVIVAQGPVQGPRPRRRPKKTWWKVVKEDCQSQRGLSST